ncbi:MAG: hypothetical protein JO199_00690, partial [Candidatus Eremiobacteraeota bacterium]|nr:hypothetical protein [Candidatus Eremiobacteraeota bacterium]
MRYAAALLTALLLCACGSHATVIPPGSSANVERGATTRPWAGYLYVLGSSTVTIYAPLSSKPTATLQLGSNPYAETVSFDFSGNLYVLMVNKVLEFAPGRHNPFRTITQGLQGATALKVDRNGTLYVGNYGIPSNVPATITEYAPGSTSVLRTIRLGLNVTPTAMAVDASNDLYVALNTQKSESIVKYALGATKPSETIVQGLSSLTVNDMRFDGTLYAACG